MTGFQDTTILRMARLQLLRGEWRRYNAESSLSRQLKDPELPDNAIDNSILDVSTINIEENGNRQPIPYVLPPGMEQERVATSFRSEEHTSESQSLMRSSYAVYCMKKQTTQSPNTPDSRFEITTPTTTRDLTEPPT